MSCTCVYRLDSLIYRNGYANKYVGAQRDELVVVHTAL